MNSKQTEKAFVQNFILKERRDRSVWLLLNKKKRPQFIHKFNHTWADMISNTNLIKVTAKSDQDISEEVKSILTLADSDLCYIISDDEYDGKFVEFKSAFENCRNYGGAYLIITVDGKGFYLETEYVSGTPDRFVGKK